MTECRQRRWLLLALALVLGSAIPAARADGARESLETGSRAPYVHRLTLYDEDGAAIDPNDPMAGPYSPRMTCGKCHSYQTISHGWHFNPTSHEQPIERLGEPWWWVDEKLGLTVPITDRGWLHMFSTGDAGLTAWDMVKRFGRHMPGGGYGEPTPEQIEESPHAARWRVSGPLEIDCMVCHSADDRYDPAERARQIERENFRWAATAALGLAVVRGEAAKLPDDFDPLAEPDPDHPERIGPKIEWDAARFDADNRVFFAITKRPPPERCYYCHTARQVGQAHELEEMLEPRDVHLAAGLTCADCHRNMMDHQMVRGYDGEAEATRQPWRAAFSCKGCHLGVEGATEAELRLGGRYGAPRPAHRGLPPIHLEKLACTACHSGPLPADEPGQFQTARAHGLGLAERGRSETQAPLVYGPIFARRVDGKIAPHLECWTRAYHRNGKLVPIPEVERAWHQLGETASNRTPMEVYGALCDAIGEADYAQYDPVSMAAPLVFLRYPVIEHRMRTGRSLYGEGGPDVVLSPMTSGEYSLPRVWPLAHDVRPASQALGAGGCTDCHAFDSPFFAGSILPPGGKPPIQVTQAELRGENKILRAVWNAAFSLRPVFKVVALTGAGLLALILLCGLVAGLVRPAVAQQADPQSTLLHSVLHTVAIIAVVFQAVTGLGGELLFDGVHGRVLLVHMAAAGLFIFSLVAVGLLWLRRMLAGYDSTLRPLQRWLFWLGLLLGWCIIVTMTLPMLPVLESGQIEEVAEIHEVCAILFVVIMVVHAVVSLRAREDQELGPEAES